MPTPVTPEQISRQDNGALWRKLYRWIRLHVMTDQVALAESMRSLIGMQNDKFWFLIAAAIIASVGLNTNSPAVVIGAMLVSPMMGPIVGVGFALAIRDQSLAYKAGRHLAFAIAVSLFVSVVYFFLSPLQDATPELLARTRPNLLDLLVALAAALAGVIALASKEVSVTLPGVAIATAIMPPLCTVGYGLATGQPKMALGAFYLFVVNAVAIALCSYLLFRRMHVTEVEEADSSRMPSWLLALVAAVFLTPLVLALVDTARESRQAAIAKTFVAEVSEEHPVANWEFSRGRKPLLTMFVFNAPSTAETEQLEKELAARIPGATLKLLGNELAPEVEKTIADLKNSLIDSNTALQQIQTAIAEQQKQSKQPVMLQPTVPAMQLELEWQTLDPRVKQIDIFAPVEEGGAWLVRAKLQPNLTVRERAGYLERWKQFLELRTGGPVELIIER